MSGLSGSFEKGGKEYEWWAGPANPDAEEDHCVHTRCGDWGVTKYVPDALDRSAAEETAQSIASHVDSIKA